MWRTVSEVTDKQCSSDSKKNIGRFLVVTFNNVLAHLDIVVRKFRLQVTCCDVPFSIYGPFFLTPVINHSETRYTGHYITAMCIIESRLL